MVSSSSTPGAKSSALADALELIGVPACALRDDGAIALANTAWRALHPSGAAPAQWPQLLHSDDLALVQGWLCAGDPDARIECRIGLGGGARWHLLAIHRAGPGAARVCTASDIHALRQREEGLRSRHAIQADMLNVSIDCIKLIDLDGNLRHLNRAGCLALGVPEDSGFGMPWLPLLAEDVREAGEQALEQARAGASARFAGRSVSPGQEQLWDNLLTPLQDASGEIRGILCVSREVTAERAAGQLLRESQERLSIAARVGGLGIWDYDIATDRLHCDASWHRIMGRDPSQPVNSLAEFRPLIHPEDVERATDVNERAADLLARGDDYSMVFRILRPDGEIRWLRSLAAVEHRDGAPSRAVGFVADITDSMRAELALRDANRALLQEKVTLAREVLKDPLTGIANRRHLDAELPRLDAYSRERGEALCIALVDVDYFKQYNDLYGHPAGDAALRRVATALRDAARHTDLVARYGGEEFAVVLPDAPDPAPAMEKFMAAVAALAIPHRGSPIGRLTISCGAVAALRTPLTMAQLFEAADEALYEAKAGGRNRYVVRSAVGR